VVSCTSSSHPDNYRTLLSHLGGAANAAAILPPAPVLQQVIITSSEETKEKKNIAVGYHTLLTIMICAKYDPDSDVLSDLKFPAPTEAFKRVSKLATKDERVRALKNILDTNNALRVAGLEHNMLIMSRDYNDVDPLVPTAIITGIYAKTEIKDMKSTSTQFTLIHFRATGKETAIALCKERSAYQLEDAVGETEVNKSKKRTTFSSTEMFTDLDSVVSYFANVISALQCMFNCANTQASSRPLLYNCIMTLFNFVTGRKTKDWFMPLFPTYIALLLDKLFVGFVKSAENYTNQCAAKDGVVANLDMDDLSREIGTLTLSRRLRSTLITTSVGLTTQLSSLSLPTPLRKDLTSGSNSPPPLTLPPLLLGAAVQAAGAALDAATAMPAVVVATAQAVVVVSTPGVPGPVSARAASETLQARVFATTKDVTSSSGARATPLGPSALRLESKIALNTPHRVFSATIPAVL
jgi:hypothetical protein